MALPIITRPSFPLSQSLLSGSFHKPSILNHQRADRMKTTITKKQPNWSHGPQPCLTQWNYEPCHIVPPKMGRSWWRGLTECGPLEKGMANHFSILDWKIPWTEEPGRLQSMESQRVGHDWATSLSLSLYLLYKSTLNWEIINSFLENPEILSFISPNFYLLRKCVVRLASLCELANLVIVLLWHYAL